MLHSGTGSDGAPRAMGSQEKPAPGDLVILAVGHMNLQALYLKPGEVIQNKHGAYLHDEMLKTPYGHRIYSKDRKGFCMILRPTPELWTNSLPHRTQILYNVDISTIILRLDIRPGNVVIESGTGSGSMTHSLARCVGPRGHVYSFDFHDIRVKTATEEFTKHGMSKHVTCRQSDVCNQGFPVPGGVYADALFLDVPNPWEAIVHANKVLRDAGGICSFSPCIEQVQKTCEALRSQGFSRLSTVEVLNRGWNIQHATLDVPRWEVQQGPQTRKNSRPPDNRGAKRKAPGDEEEKEGKGGGRTEEGGADDVTVAKPFETISTVRPNCQEKGHTSFLTFARRGIRK